MRIALVLLLSCTAAAAEPALCRGDARLPSYAGLVDDNYLGRSTTTILAG